MTSTFLFLPSGVVPSHLELTNFLFSLFQKSGRPRYRCASMAIVGSTSAEYESEGQSRSPGADSRRSGGCNVGERLVHLRSAVAHEPDPVQVGAVRVL